MNKFSTMYCIVPYCCLPLQCKTKKVSLLIIYNLKNEHRQSKITNAQGDA